LRPEKLVSPAYPRLWVPTR